MITTLDALFKTLNIDHASGENLEKLIHWCEAHVSTDVHVTGDIESRFKAYQDLAFIFLEKLQPNVQSSSLTESLPALNNMTPLQQLVDLGLDIYLKALAPKPEQIQTKVNGFTLLQLAAVKGNLHTVEALLALGANPEETIIKGNPLIFNTLTRPIDHDEHMISNKEFIYKIFSRLSKNIFTDRNESGDNILHVMAVNGYVNLIQDILDHAIELVSTPNNAIRYPIHAAILNAQHECAKRLIAVKGVEDLTDAKGQNALHYAARYGDREMVQICMASSIAIDSIDERHQTPLILASRAQNTDAMQTLLSAGAKVNEVDNGHRTALHYAVEANDVDMVNLLLSTKGIDVNIRDDDAQNPLDLVQASTPEGNEISELLMKKDAVHGQGPFSSI